MRALVFVTLKPGVLDPQGKAIEGALASLGVEGINGVRQGKLFEVDLAETDPDTAQASLKQACERLLANTVIENYRVKISGRPTAQAAREPAAAPALPNEAPQAAEPQTAAEGAPTPPGANAVDPAAATEAAAADAAMPTEGHP